MSLQPPTWDVVIVGAGTAGIPAALFAARRGAKVLLLESSGKIGGTLALSTGSFSGAGSKLQAASGIDDSSSLHLRDSLRISGGTSDVPILSLWVDHAAATFDWLIDEGLELGPALLKTGTAHEDYEISRVITPPGLGDAYIAVLEPILRREIESGAISLRCNTNFESLIVDANGSVAGIRICGDADCPVEIRARNTVLACGGYSANDKLWRQFHGRPLRTCGNPMSLGHGITAAVDAGAKVIHRDRYIPTFGGTSIPGRPGAFGFTTAMMPRFRKPWEIYVDRQGRRFMAEDDVSPHRREHAIMALDDESFWCVYDQGVADEAPALFLPNAGLTASVFGTHADFIVAPTIGDLAMQCGMLASVLEAAIQAYNAAQSAGSDPLGRRFMPLPIGSPPFYAIRHYGVSVLSFAGIATDTSLRVINAAGHPIRNLYAAGEILGMGVFGHAYLGGAMVSSALTFGRLLGERILQWR